MLRYIKPFVSFLPEIEAPGRNINLQEKLSWTTLALILYLIASQIPLFGVAFGDSVDPLYWMRMMMASNRGTLMELGISPIISSGMVMQALVSLRLFTINMQIKEDQILYQASEKLIALIVTFGQAIVQVSSGFYGEPSKLGWVKCALLVIQLLLAGIMVILLDELLQKGYGIGSGANLFIATNVAEGFLWSAFSPKVFNTVRGLEFEGSIISLFHLLFSRKSIKSALYEAFFRKNLSNVSSLLFTTFLFCLVIYLHGLKIELPVESTSLKGQNGKWPIKLIYSSTMPIIVQSFVISHTSTLSAILFKKFPNWFLIRMIGVWEKGEYGKQIPVSGLCYILHPPKNLYALLVDPFQFIMHLIFMLVSAAIFSRYWVDINDSSEEAVARKLKNQKLTIRGVREQNLKSYLSQYIPTAAFLGGLSVGLVCFLAGILDSLGSGTNIFLVVSIIWQYYELFTKEQLKSGGLGYHN